MNLSYKTIGWAVVTGIGLAGMLNTVLVIAAGLGRFNLGNSLPAILGLALAGIGFRKLLRPEQPLFRSRRLRYAIRGVFCLGVIWLAGTLYLIGFGWQGNTGKSPEWIIVPGAGLRGDQLSLTLMSRLDTAAMYWRSHPDLKIVVSGGQGADELIPEAEAMYRYLEQAGIPAAQLVREPKATSTWENLAFSKAVISQAGRDPEKPVIIVTSRYHLFRAIGIAGRQGLQAYGVPAPTPGSVVVGSYLRELLAVSKFLLTGH